MSEKTGTDRRDFLRGVALSGAAVLPGMAQEATAAESKQRGKKTGQQAESPAEVTYPRSFSGPALAMISFPLGGVGAGSVGLGGRGQLRDWEIFNRADKGNSLLYAFPSIWVESEGNTAAHVLEARIETPYEGQDGLGSSNAPGLSRLQGATFTGEFPQARVDFHDQRLPVSVHLEAGTPFIPLDADASGLPLAVLRYRVRNTSQAAVTVSIAYSIENPVKPIEPPGAHPEKKDTRDRRINEIRKGVGLQGLYMHNPGLEANDTAHGSFALALLNASDGEFSALQGWPAGRWWNSPLLFWDDFSSDGALGPATEKPSETGAICLKRKLAAGAEGEYCFLLAWHFPNRTPKRCGWDAPKGHEETVIGNWYATRFPDAWAVAEHAARDLPGLEKRTRQFVTAVRESTLPGAVKDAAMSNLSTLVTPTCFRTADGEFHGFEGINDKIGCCFGNCTHVWNYETATANLFPSLSRSLRQAAFGYSMDERGGMHFRQLLPDGVDRFSTIAADGQMGQIMKVYIDWQLSGDRAFLAELWPKVKRAIEFAWVPGGWDANKDGVLEGVQHNTYDVEFYGPNPLCEIYYLGALRAAEEMARASGDQASAGEYRQLFERGRQWTEANLFNGEYYKQIIEGHPASEIASGLRLGAGADDPEHPQFQVGDGCLVDQLLGQYLADVAGLGPLVDPAHVQKTLDAIYRYNHKPALFDHNCVQRTFALNDEAALVICDYGRGKRPKIPFPYYAEVMTGFEHSAAVLMLYRGMPEKGLECISDIRRRYDGVRRNPWDEAECGHHYARAMASWSGVLATSGFRYQGADRRVVAMPPQAPPNFRSFWSAASGWGVFSLGTASGKMRLAINATEGALAIRSIELRGNGKSVRVANGGQSVEHTSEMQDGRVVLTLKDEVRLEPGRELTVEL